MRRMATRFICPRHEKNSRLFPPFSKPWKNLTEGFPSLGKTGAVFFQALENLRSFFPILGKFWTIFFQGLEYMRRANRL